MARLLSITKEKGYRYSLSSFRIDSTEFVDELCETSRTECEPKSDDILQEEGVYSAPCLDEESDIFLTASHKESGGFYSNVYNTASSIIIADNLLSPAEALKKGDKQGEAPGLASWADVAFLQYEELARKNEDNIQDLQYIFQAVISNDETISVVNYIALKNGQGVRNWDNKLTFSLNSDEGKALIGTPNGKGAGWLAATHKNQLGNKTIKDISVFTEDDCDFHSYMVKAHSRHTTNQTYTRT